MGGRRFAPSFSESVLGRHLARARIFSQAELVTLENNIENRKMRLVRKSLSNASLWIWSGIPEEFLVPTVAAETAVETRLLHHGVLAGPVQIANRKTRLVNALHGLGHKPEVLQDVVRALHAANALSRRECCDLVRRIIS